MNIIEPGHALYTRVAVLFERARASRFAPFPPATDGLGKHWERFEDDGVIKFREMGDLTGFEQNYAQTSTQRSFMATPEPESISADRMGEYFGDSEIKPNSTRKSPKVKPE